MMEILKAIRASGNQVTFIPADLAHRSPYAQNLQRIGIEVVHHPFYPSVPDYLEEHGREFDLVILSRADVASRFVEPVKRHAPRAKLVFDTVDLHFLREGRAALLLNDARLRNAARRRKRQELVLATQCDATVVVSPVEKTILESECPGLVVHLLPTIMEIPREEPPSFEDRRSVLFIGGFAHPPNVDAVVYFVEEILPLIVARLPDVVFVVVGSNTPDRVRDLAGKNVQVPGFVQNVKPILDQARVAVAPLRFGAGVKGKVNLSMAHGIPTVVSSIAAEGMHLVHEDNAMIADDPASFASAIVRLYTSKELWERTSANGRQNVREHFSVESASRQIAGLLELAGLGSQTAAREELRFASTIMKS
jgi:glycosyltransferase involved in cell wall biosynthesis